MRRKTIALSLCLLLASAGVAFAETSINEVFSQLEQQYQLPQGILGKVANVESGGNPNAGSNSSSAYGLFQWTAASWYAITRAVYGQSLDLSQRANPVTSAKMTAAALRQALNQNGGLIQSAQIDTTLGLYMCHFLGSAGCGKFFQAYIQNPNAVGAGIFPREAASNPSVFGGRTLGQILNFFAQRLRVAGVGVNVSGNFEDKYGISYAYSNADVSAANFMPKSFVPPAQDPYRTYQTSYAPISQSQPLQTPSTTAQPKLVSNLGQQGGAIALPAKVQSSALIITQPEPAQFGNPLLVSWTSVGMSESSPCTVSIGQSVIATSNAGSKHLDTRQIGRGTATFTLACTKQDGTSVSQTASATIQ